MGQRGQVDYRYMHIFSYVIFDKMGIFYYIIVLDKLIICNII